MKQKKIFDRFKPKSIKLEGVSLRCIKADNMVRKICHRVVQHALFDFSVILLIVFSTATATLE